MSSIDKEVEDLAAPAGVVGGPSLNGSTLHGGEPPDLGFAPGEFTLLDFDWLMNQPPKEFIVEGLIGRRDAAMMFGPPKAAKSLVILDLIAAIISGSPFADHFEVNGFPNVIYCYGEGRSGMPNRIRALQHKWSLSPEQRARMKFLPIAPGLRHPDQPGHIERFANYLLSMDQYRDFLNGGLLVIDTFARATQGGDENEAGDTSIMLGHFDNACGRLDCSGLLNHHENHQGRIRGSTNLPASFDTIIQVKKVAGERGKGVLAFSDGKDVGGFTDLGFSIQIHEWYDAQGRIHGGGFIEWTGPVESSKPEDKQASTDRMARLEHLITTEWVGIDKAVNAIEMGEALGVHSTTAQRNINTLKSLKPELMKRWKSTEKRVVDKLGKDNRTAKAFYLEKEEEALGI